jgi:hypothetical protein
MAESFFATFSASDNTFWSKVKYIDQLRDIYNYISNDQIIIPENIFEYVILILGFCWDFLFGFIIIPSLLFINILGMITLKMAIPIISLGEQRIEMKICSCSLEC